MRRIFMRAALLSACSLTALAQTVAVPPPDQSPGQFPVRLPDMVITATRVPTPVLDIPAGVTVIDRREMQQAGDTDLAQALMGVPGVRLSQSGGPGGNASLFVRGLNSNQVLVLRDGMPLNDAADSSGAFNFGLDTLADVERIEVIRGPMAALYGSGAIAGVVNLITRRGRETGTQLTGEIGGGPPGQVLGNAAITGVTDGWDYAAIGEGQWQRGFDTVPQRMSVYRGIPQDYATGVGTLNLGYTPFAGTRLSLLARVRRADFGFNALGFPIYDNANARGHADDVLGRVGGSTTLFNGTVESSLFVGRLQNDRRYTQQLDPNDPNQASNDSRYHARRTDVQWNNTVHLSDLLEAPWQSATDLTFGYQHIQDDARVRVNSAFFGDPYTQSATAGMATNAVFAGAQTTLWERLTLIGQVRQDWVMGQAPFTWRLGGVLAVPEIFTRVKAAYGTAFRAPSLFDRYGVDSFGYVGNPNLRPETSRGWEAGFTTDLPAFGLANGISFGATYFDNRVRNLIVVQFAPAYTSVNIGAAHTQGLETVLTVRPASWLSATIAWTETEARDSLTGQLLLRRPQNTLAASATITPLPGLSVRPELQYTGPFRDYLIDNAGFTTSPGRSPPGLVVNLAVNYVLTPKLTLYGTGRNLTNSRFEPVNGYQMPGALGIVGVRVKL